MIRISLLALTVLLQTSGLGEVVSFRRDIAPILLKQCQSCHGPDKVKGKYRVDTFARAMQAGSGALPAFVAHNLEESEAFFRITTEDETERMPADSDPLSDSSIALIKLWIEQGAVYDGDDPNAPLSMIVPDIEHPKPPESYPHSIPITALAFARDGSEVFVSGHHEITVWSTTKGTLTRRITNQGERTYALALHPTEPWLAAAGGNPGRLGELRVFHSETGALLQVLAKTSDVALTTAFSPSGDRLAVGSADRQIRIYDLPEFEEALVLANHSDWVTALTWNAKGDRLVSGSRDKTAKVFEIPEGKRLTTYSGHEKTVQGLSFSPDNDQIYSASADGALDLWQISDGKRTTQLRNALDQAFSLSASSSQLFVTTSRPSIEVFGIGDDKDPTTWDGHHRAWIISSAYTSNHKQLATGDYNGKVCVWDTATGLGGTHFVAFPGGGSTGP